MSYKLTVISSGEPAMREVCRQLRNYLGPSFRIKGYYLGQLKGLPPIEDDLVLISAPSFARQIIPHIKPGVAYIMMRRTIDPERINRLLRVPPNSRVLVVNDFVTSAYGLIEELREFDILPLRYFPYEPYSGSFEPDPESWPGQGESSAEDFLYAITAGERELVPGNIPHVIDLGQRKISLLTVGEILRQLTGSPTYDSLVMSRYNKGVIQVNVELHRLYEKNMQLQNQLAAVIANAEQGVLLVSEEREVMVANKLALRLLGAEGLVGRRLDQVLSPQTLEALRQTGFQRINDREIYVEERTLDQGHGKGSVVLTLQAVSKIQDIDRQYRQARKETGMKAKYSFANIVARSDTMERLITRAKSFARTDAAILISGESGTGKELLAQAVHNASPRAAGPFVAINCTALTESLLESELFGYAEGAFTGAKRGGKKGLLELARGGSLFLDEVGSAPPSIQAKLLRVLQEKEVLPVGGASVIPVDVRIIAATNRNLYEQVRRGSFRLDLYYRLKVLPLFLPPLSQRREDIGPLFRHFIRARKPEFDFQSLPEEELMEIFARYPWPGNIRELQNIAEYIVSVPGNSDLLREIRWMLYGGPGWSAAGAEAEAEAGAKEAAGGAETAGAGESGGGKAAAPPPAAYRSLEQKRQCEMIMAALAEGHGQGLGMMSRKWIAERLREKGETLSPQQIKCRMELLGGQGLVEGRPGRGSWLTRRGRELAGVKAGGER